MSKKVLIVGSGGREHALGWSIAQDESVSEVLYAKGNPGTALEEKGRNLDIDGTKEENFTALADIVDKECIDMVIVGTEQPLVEGIVNFFNHIGYKRIFGPTTDASKTESDKFFSYRLMNYKKIPQAKSKLCFDLSSAKRAINEMVTDEGIVIKARGLTAGKGVYVCKSKKDALAKLEEHTRKYGSEVLIAERLFGQEFSVFGISDGKNILPLEMSVQDHKRQLDGDKGPNTGGMGAYGPAPIADRLVVKDVSEKMMKPVIDFMRKDKHEYKGFLYAAVIMTKDGPKILEYNCRFGDPEAQPSVMMLKNGLYQPISSALEGKLGEINIEFKQGASCCVVMASNGYPESFEKGLPIGGLKAVAEIPDVKVFHAGTATDNGKIVNSGGRVLGVTAYSENGIKDAQELAYYAVSIIDKFTRRMNDGKQVLVYRKDIAHNALKR